MSNGPVSQTQVLLIYRYDLILQSACPDTAEVIETVRLIRGHVEARISALSGTP